jgi:acyl-CoA reductase-like NAD-dependent aldehyde dehydrogenase
VAVAPFRLWIGGEPVDTAGHYEIVNPATEQLVGVAPDAGAGEARAAAQAAAAAFPGWAATPPAERGRLLARAAELFERRFDELVPLVQAETGSTLAMTRAVQVPTATARLRRYAAGAQEPTLLPLPPTPNLGGPGGGGTGLVSALGARRPVGVVAAITSYNVPLANVVGKLGPALAMGNTVVVKPAPQDPLGVIRLVETLHEAGFPPGVVNLVVGRGAACGEALVTAPEVDMVSFTGSTAVGAAIAESAGRSFTRTLLELGGKGASLVFADADVEAAVAGTASTFAFHAGQICTAPTRLIAHRSVYDEVVSRLAALASALPVGDPTDAATVVGPVISAAQRARVEDHVASAVADGGTLVAGGERPALDTGFFVAPTLVADCRPRTRAVQEEIFGPVVVALPFDDDEEGVALANDTEFGLYDYVWTRDTTRAMAVAARLRTGNVGINTVARNPETPFGGFKHSGIGRDGGSFGLHAYSELQSVVWPG